MKVSFKQATESADNTPRDKEEVSQAIAPVADKTLATSAPVDDFIGEATREDIRLPRLYLVGKTGDLSNTFDSGSFVIAKEAAIGGEKSPLVITVIRGLKQYQNNVPWDDPERQEKTRIFNTPQEVKEAGGVITYEKGDDNYSAIAHFELLIEKPEDIGPEGESFFFNEVAGKQFAHVIWTLSGSAYSAVAVPVLTARLSGHLRQQGFRGGSWTLSSKIVTKGKLSWWTPVIRSNGMHPPEFLEALAAEKL